LRQKKSSRGNFRYQIILPTGCTIDIIIVISHERQKMTNKPLLIIIISALFIGCKTQQKVYPIKQVKLYPISKNGLWGYADEKGELEIPYQFEKVTFYSGDRASVKLDGKFGFINGDGEYLIKPKYDSIGYFNHTEAIVTKNGENSTINRKGKKLNKGISIGRCGAGIEYASNPNDFFDKVGNKFILNNSDFENQRRLDPTAKFEIDDFTFDDVIPFSSKSVIVIKDDKFDIYVHYNSVGLKGIWAEEVVPNFENEREGNNLIQANNAKFRVGEKWGLISILGHIELEPEFYEIEKAPGIFYIVEYKPKHWGCMTLRKRYFKQ